MSENPYESTESSIATKPIVHRLKRTRKISGIIFLTSIGLALVAVGITQIFYNKFSNESSADIDRLSEPIRIGLGITAGIAPFIFLSGIITVITTVLLWVKSAKN